ncbi:MAG: hypothetical protein AAF617_01295 [Bacteroidota bacterium]
MESQKHFVFAVFGGGQLVVAGGQVFDPGGHPLVGQFTVHWNDSNESQGFDNPPYIALIRSKDAIFDF